MRFVAHDLVYRSLIPLTALMMGGGATLGLESNRGVHSSFGVVWTARTYPGPM